MNLLTLQWMKLLAQKLHLKKYQMLNVLFSNYCGVVYLGSYSRIKAHLLKINNKGIEACPIVTPSHRQEMQRMHDQVENDKLEREQRSRFPLPPPLPSRGPIPISPFRR